MKLVCTGVERARELDPHLEGLPTPDDEIVVMVTVGVVLLPVLAGPAFHQVH